MLLAECITCTWLSILQPASLLHLQCVVALPIPAFQRSVHLFISVIHFMSSVALRLMIRPHWAPPVHVDRLFLDRYPHTYKKRSKLLHATQLCNALARTLGLADRSIVTVASSHRWVCASKPTLTHASASNSVGQLTHCEVERDV